MSSSIKKNLEVVFHISSSWVKIRLHTENQLPGLPGSALKASVGVGGVVVGSTALCGHTNFVFGLKLGCDKNVPYSGCFSRMHQNLQRYQKAITLCLFDILKEVNKLVSVKTNQRCLDRKCHSVIALNLTQTQIACVEYEGLNVIKR